MQKICLVEDEKSIADLIQLNLEIEGYKVVVYDDGEKAKTGLKSSDDFALIILDVMLPGVSGVDLCRHIRKTSDVPVLFLSAKGTAPDRVHGLRAGGNDYLAKPFDLEELLLRVSNLAGNSKSTPEETIRIGDFTVNFKTFSVTNMLSGEELTLSKKEIGIIKLFNARRNQVVSRNEILDEVWGADRFPTTRTIDNFILNFRKIFEQDPRSPQYFHSVRGVGYKFTP